MKRVRRGKKKSVSDQIELRRGMHRIVNIKPLKIAVPSVAPLIQRRAYGFRSFSNYRLRVIAQCG
jgi:hypothetical protein